MPKSIPTPTIGEILRSEFLEPLEVTPYRLAKDLGVSTSTILDLIHELVKARPALVHILTGETTPDINMLDLNTRKINDLTDNLDRDPVTGRRGALRPDMEAKPGMITILINLFQKFGRHHRTRTKLC